ncbi:prolipoprotein diacylglyceryl transferase [Gorillibacterium massiliense]|uniref:prolipoprotein diacylglyceryl transferase n=1 Tax=Gorillibacterium massiliense TaxID=1280390 RepID=UPI0004B5C845|nr:prolipoprotein diacylglyceryl transferase [Gorillibacterium massiliense]
MDLVLNRVAFSIGDLISVKWYGIILALGALAGLALAVWEGKRYKIVPDFFMDLLLIGVPSALVGARAYYVIFQWDDYKNNLWNIFKVWEGGIAIYGALIGAIIGAFFYIRAKGYSFWRIADICAPSLLAGQIIGRWGNFMNQEAHGGPTTESFLRHTLHLPSFIVNQMNIDGVYYHPTFLYESLWNLIGILILFWLRRRPFLRAGELFMSYFIWYAIGRFYIEGLRTDSLAFNGPDWLNSFIQWLWSPMKGLLQAEAGSMSYGTVRTSQLVAIFAFIGAIALIVIRRKMGYAKEKYSDPIISTKIQKNTTEVAAEND